MKTILRALQRIEVELPGCRRIYHEGQEIKMSSQDELTEKGLYVCWGHGGYTLIPRESLEVVSESR